jgi:hypothetical protein
VFINRNVLLHNQLLRSTQTFLGGGSQELGQDEGEWAEAGWECGSAGVVTRTTCTTHPANGHKPS